MIDLHEINRKLALFEARVNQREWAESLKLNYIALYRQILEAEQTTTSELIRRAKIIKPLVRLKSDGTCRCFGQFDKYDRLVFINPGDICQSYLFNFKSADIVTDVTLPKLTKITSFTCYHKYGGYPGFFRPGVDEVLAQIPRSVDIKTISAFEISVNSLAMNDIYDLELDRHVTTVILYAMKGGLPACIASQPVICNKEVY